MHYRKIQVSKVIERYNKRLMAMPTLFNPNKIIMIMNLRNYAVNQEVKAYIWLSEERSKNE